MSASSVIKFKLKIKRLYYIVDEHLFIWLKSKQEKRFYFG